MEELPANITKRSSVKVVTAAEDVTEVAVPDLPVLVVGSKAAPPVEESSPEYSSMMKTPVPIPFSFPVIVSAPPGIFFAQ